jgi:ATP-dependent helicase/nuclease subunit B
MLAPDIRALGDLEGDEGAPVAEVALDTLTAAITPGHRLGTLARFVRQHYAGNLNSELSPASALSSARDLIKILDSAALAPGADWARLGDLVQDAELARHWEVSVDFLRVITEQWPAYLHEARLSEPFVRRRSAAEALVRSWTDTAPQAPVIVAGSTGATPAGRIIMRAVLSLPRGAIVFPGFTGSLSASTQASVLSEASHPQHMLLKTVMALGSQAGDVMQWPGVNENAQSVARRQLVLEALAPAEETSDWRETFKRLGREHKGGLAGFADDALAGLNLIELENDASEAEAAAILLRETLETPGKTAALVTPDAGLARRVSALLRRWKVHVQPSSGIPLGRTQAGSLVCLCARWLTDPSDPVLLTALLKHPLIVGFDDADTLERRFLRGTRAWRSLEALKTSLPKKQTVQRHAKISDEELVAASALVDRLIEILSRVETRAATEVEPRRRAGEVAELVSQFSADGRVWQGEDGRCAAKLLEFIAELGDALGPLTPLAFADLIDAESTRYSVYDETPDHPRLAIWGPLEARLQTADRLVLAGLNEGVWPEPSPADAFLPRRFRPELGLGDAEDRVGLAAHDFSQLASAPEVYLLHARRHDDAPAVASRWVWRLKTFAEGALGKARASDAFKSALPVEEWVSALHSQGMDALPGFNTEPRPTRVPEGWPNALSVTRINVLQRDPYAVWAETAIGLTADEPLGAGMDVRVRGTAVHKALEEFDDGKGARTAERLMTLLETCLSEAGEPPESWLAREAVWRRTVEDFLIWYEAHRAEVKPRGSHREIGGRKDFQIAGAPFTLTGVADRIDVLNDGTLSIIDFKTGNPPSSKEIRSGLEQQMPLMALMVREGAFRELGPRSVSSLEYVAFKAKFVSRRVEIDCDLTPAELARDAEQGLFRLIAAYREQAAPILSAPRIQFRSKFEGDFDRLARRAEWDIDGAGGGDDG